MSNELTKEQIAKFPEYIDYWTKVGLSTEQADRPRAEAAIQLMYKTANLDAPKIIWTGSPLSNGLTYAILKDKKFIKKINNELKKLNKNSFFDKIKNKFNISDSVKTSVGGSVWASVRNSVRNSVGDSVGDSVWASVGDSVWASVGDSVWNSVGASVRDSLRDSVWDSVRDSVYGQHYAHISAFYSFFKNELNLEKEVNPLNEFIELTQSAGWILPFKNICFVSERTSKLNFDSNGRLHSETEEALAYPDGFKIYAIHGVRVPEYIILNPEKITISSIEKESNVEVKRIMISRYKDGYKSYIFDSGAVLIDENEILPCPFCGKNPTTVLIPYFEIVCESCDIAPHTECFTTKIDAIEQWNKRS